MSKTTICPGCGLHLPSEMEQLDERYNASYACRELCGELSAYTLSLGDEEFIHQLVVDAYAAQHASTAMKPIAITFALAGLYLRYEHNYTGKQVQHAHMLLARTPKNWSHFNPPEAKATITILDILNTPDSERTATLEAWGKAVWNTWKPEHARIASLVNERLKV
ncbi:DUF5946 family protein [Ktedonospora formicarum]|uniref:Uncharacterized protein n=1 Tax=Ktedonospora formicarum TaxID=2778364 RepID=A0A8J3I401_9CHLR|nr:DUF5946 family protein [Ktedonospora formicarum]GHO46433.1 hypothetical protein KSX_45960 [Ktedonospora formicarum]